MGVTPSVDRPPSSYGLRVRVLILGGTAQARALAETLHGRGRHLVISSLAGRTSQPVLPEGEVRVGGFGGVDGLVRYLRAAAIDVVVDATHPFAETMSAHATRAAEVTGVRLVALRRPRWSARPGDRWIPVPDLPSAAREVVGLPQRGSVFLTIGRQDLAVFAGDDRHAYLIRSVDPPEGPLPSRHTVVLGRGPYTVDGEGELMREHSVTALVTRNSGGESSAAKLLAARRRGIPVIMVEPPAPPAAVTSVETVAEIVSLLDSDDSRR
jgi:precorrin-6A/cobalt-precorrin-6A reductase